MDALDLEILSLIQNDARVAHASVEAWLDSASGSRTDQAPRTGWRYSCYLTSIDQQAVNQTLLAFVRVMLNASRKDEQAFEAFVKEESNTLECHDIAGEDSYMLKIRNQFSGFAKATAL